MIQRRTIDTVRCAESQYQKMNIEITSDAAIISTKKNLTIWKNSPTQVSLWSSTTVKKDWERQLAVYADFDCSLIKSDEPGVLHKHEPNSAAFYFVNTFNHSKHKPWSYVGKDCVAKLIIEQSKLAQ